MTKPVHNLPLTIGEIFTKIKAAGPETERAELLKEHDHPALQAVLRLNFDPNINFTISENALTKYKPSRNPIGFGQTHIKGIYKKFYIFVKRKDSNLRQSKRDILWVQLLEQLDAVEAQLLIDAKDKKLDVGLTIKLVNEVFPGLLPEESTPIEIKTDEPEITLISNETAPAEAKAADAPVEVIESSQPKVKKPRVKKQKEGTNEAPGTGEGV